MNRDPTGQQAGVVVMVRGSVVDLRFVDGLPIGELLTELSARFHRTRQSGINEELFEVVAGFDAMAPQRAPSA